MSKPKKPKKAPPQKPNNSIKVVSLWVSMLRNQEVMSKK